MSYREKYETLVAELEALSAQTGLYLTDCCVDRENIDRSLPEGSEEQYAALYDSACCAAGGRAEEVGKDINALLGRIIY